MKTIARCELQRASRLGNTGNEGSSECFWNIFSWQWCNDLEASTSCEHAWGMLSKSCSGLDIVDCSRHMQEGGGMSNKHMIAGLFHQHIDCIVDPSHENTEITHFDAGPANVQSGSKVLAVWCPRNHTVVNVLWLLSCSAWSPWTSEHVLLSWSDSVFHLVACFVQQTSATHSEFLLQKE